MKKLLTTLFILGIIFFSSTPRPAFAQGTNLGSAVYNAIREACLCGSLSALQRLIAMGAIRNFGQKTCENFKRLSDIMSGVQQCRDECYQLTMGLFNPINEDALVFMAMCVENCGKKSNTPYQCTEVDPDY